MAVTVRVSPYSPGFISREWIETIPPHCTAKPVIILPALLVGSGLKPIRWQHDATPPPHSPGFISREWIETLLLLQGVFNPHHSPGFISREWIETSLAMRVFGRYQYSPGFISREWIETAIRRIQPCWH